MRYVKQSEDANSLKSDFFNQTLLKQIPRKKGKKNKIKIGPQIESADPSLGRRLFMRTPVFNSAD